MKKIIYAFVQAAVKHSLAQFSITPTLEFDMDINIQQSDAVSKPFTQDKQEAVASSSLFKTFTQKNQAHFIEPDKSALKSWKSFYEPAQQDTELPGTPRQDDFNAGIKEQVAVNFQSANQLLADSDLIQLHHTYIIAPTQTGFLLIHQQAAHERVLYERYSAALTGTAMVAQRTLFPATLELSAQDTALLHDLLPDLKQLGYIVEPFGNNSFVIQATPADVEQGQ